MTGETRIGHALGVLDLLCVSARIRAAGAVGWRNDDGDLILGVRHLGPPGDAKPADRAAAVNAVTRGLEDVRNHHAVSVKGVPESWGMLIGRAVELGMEAHPWVLHHAGFRYPDREAFRIALSRRAGPDVVPRESRAPDHERGYTPVFDAYRRVRYYLEDQFFPDGPHDHGRHWDVVTADPLGFAEALAAPLGVSVRRLPQGAASPWTAVWVEDPRDGPLGIMARPEWWEVPA